MAKLLTSSVLSAFCVKCHSHWEEWGIILRGESVSKSGEAMKYEQSATPDEASSLQIIYSPRPGYYSKTTADNPRKQHIEDKL